MDVAEYVDFLDKGLWNSTATSKYLDFDQVMDRFQLPVLVISGENDQIAPAEESIRLRKGLPSADLTLIPECGNFPHE